MEFAKDSIIYIIGLLVSIIIGYLIYILYVDSISMNNNINILKSNIEELQEKLHKDTDEELSTTSETQSWNNNIFDKLMIDTEHLKQLQDLQEEIKGSSYGHVQEIHEDEDINEEVPEDQINISEDQEINDDKEDNIPDDLSYVTDKNIKFLFDTPKEKIPCNHIFKSGKNKGGSCSKDKSKCKQHNNS